LFCYPLHREIKKKEEIIDGKETCESVLSICNFSVHIFFYFLLKLMEISLSKIDFSTSY